MTAPYSWVIEVINPYTHQWQEVECLSFGDEVDDAEGNDQAQERINWWRGQFPNKEYRIIHRNRSSSVTPVVIMT